MKYNTKKTGYQSIFEDYQAAIFKQFLDNGPEYEQTSRQAYDWINGEGKEHMMRASISRASVINSLNTMVEEGLLLYREQSGKGGYHRIYYLSMPSCQIEDLIVVRILSHLRENFPKVSKEVISIA